MAVVSGKSGWVMNGAAALACIRDWQISYTADLKAAVCNVSRGAPFRIQSIFDWVGTWKSYGPYPAAKPGDAITFRGAITGTSPNVKGVEGSAIVERVEITCDIENGGIIEHTVTFAGNGALSRTSTSSWTNATTYPTPYPARLGKVETAAPAAVPTFAELGDVRNWTLSLQVALQAYASSSTALYRKRVVGPFDASLTIGIFADNLTTMVPLPNEVKHVRLYTEAAKYWDIKWARFSGVNGYDVDIETGKPVGCTLAAGLSGVENPGAGYAGGWVKDPDGTAYWDGSQ